MTATMTTQTLTAMAEKMMELEGVQSANVWTRVAGKERLYVELTKRNGGKHWHGGYGLKVYVAAADGQLHIDDEWAGAATREHHKALGTLDAIKAIVASFGAPAEVEAALSAA